MKLYNRKRLRQLGSLILVLAGFYFILSKISIGRSIEVIKNSEPVFFAGSAVVLGVIYYMMGMRWKVLLAEKGISIRGIESFQNICISNFLNIFIPARGGDIYRGYLSSDKDRDTFDMSVIVLMERVADVLVVAFLLGVSVASFYPATGILKYLYVAAFFLLTGSAGLKFLRETEKLPIDFLNIFYQEFRDYVVENFKTENLPRLLLLTTIIWLLGIFRTQFVVSGLDISIGSGAVAVAALSWALVSAIPLTPSGFGTTDAVLFSILSAYGVPPSRSAAFILMNRVILQGFPLVTGGIYYTRRNLL